MKPILPNQLLFYGLGILLILSTSSCQKNKYKSLFKLLEAKHTGITFANELAESDSMNMLTFTNFYTGSGVGIGDINNDGMPDIYFGANMTTGRLYINQGNLQFEDITESAGLKTDRWITGVSMVDINQDGFLDLYLCVSGPGSGKKLENLLFINNGDNTFTEMAEIYGLNDASQSTFASFFDYDNDGDLDMFLIINPTDYPINYMGQMRRRMVNGEAQSTDKLYRNNGDGTFTDVSKEAGILIEGYSLGLNTSDINGDGWIDIFVANDFVSSDILYINNGDGTFTDQAHNYFKHTSFASMGADVADINNDGLPDIFVADMYPEDSYREKKLIPGSSFNTFNYMLAMGYHPQYSRNVLHLNNGNTTFSEIGQMAGVDKTDWSWGVLLADFDNDGYRDIYVANGFRRDVGDLDYLRYNDNSPFVNPGISKELHYKSILDQSGTKLQNYAFKNTGELTFQNVSNLWGFNRPSYSNGIASVDLDNDGDLDIVVNNIDDLPFIYENRSDSRLSDQRYLKIHLRGEYPNTDALGTKVKLKYGGKTLYQQHNPYRGYLSTVDNVLHFGLGNADTVDSLEIFWPDGNYSLLKNIKSNTTLTVDYESNIGPKPIETTKSQPLFIEVSNQFGLAHVHQQDPFFDFAVQPLLPHQHSQNGPGMAVGDVNGDGQEDVFIGGSAGYSAHLFLQTDSGSFNKTVFPHHPERDDMGALLFDANNDGYPDLYVVGGGTKGLYSNISAFSDRLYLNDGKGNFKEAEESLPEIISSGSCVIAADYDQDGMLDLFVGGRVSPASYPKTPQSHLLKNIGGKFVDVTQSVAPDLSFSGMVTSAIWTDFDNDGWVDLIVVGEWMPVSVFKNDKGKLINITKSTALKNSHGWWNSIVAGDFDQDGDIDYVVGNLGLNSNNKATQEKPLYLFAKDFDENGAIDPILCRYYGDELYPVHLRDALVKHIPKLQKRFNSYEQYARATTYDIFSKEELKDAMVLKSLTFESSYIENLGDGNFKISPLPLLCQMAPVFGMVAKDVNGDGFLDILMVGNSYATEVLIGRYDAFTGAYLEGDGTGKFKVSRGNENGFFVDSDAKSLVEVVLSGGKSLYLVASNGDRLKAFSDRFPKYGSNFVPNNSDQAAIITLKNGKPYRHEFYNGSSYLSQSSRQLALPPVWESAVIIDNVGNRRDVAGNVTVLPTSKPTRASFPRRKVYHRIKNSTSTIKS